MATAAAAVVVLKSIGTSPFQGPSSSSDGGGDTPVVGGEDTDEVVTKWPFGFMVTVAIAAICSGIASMVLTTSYIVDTACVCLYVVAPIAVVQKIKLSKLGSLRAQQNKLRKNVNEFSAENTRLSSNVEKLNGEVSELKTVSSDLAAITKKSGGQTDRIVEIVKENGQIQSQIKRHLETQVILNAVLASDTDEDFSISVNEIARMKLRLKNIPGIRFDEKNFDAMYANKGRAKELKLNDIMKMLRNLKDDIPEQQNIFHIETKQLAPKKRSILGF